MIGRYDGFPEIIQAKALLSYSVPEEKLPSLIVEALSKLNGCSEESPKNLENIDCRYEVGMADGYYFNYLEEDECKRLKKELTRQSIEALDFLVCIFYRCLNKNGRYTALWADWQYVRFFFKQIGQLEIRIHHFKGTRRIPLDELIWKILSYLNTIAKEKRFEPLKLVEHIGH